MGSSLLLGQNCDNHHMDGDCRYDLKRGHKLYTQSRSALVSPLDTTEFDIVFYGQKDYILSFCTHKKMYPIHFVLIDKQTEQVLYDNEEDKFLESLGLGFDVTKSLIIRINVLARESTEEEIQENVGCLGLLIQYKNYPNKKVKLQM
ncbi:MAG: hypothetical protein CSA96_00470 [Bacteroidetes bacterium]|nr:MAG: hypothetical protein CSA96_00470 [Bacteroidota bacterium]